MYLNQDKIQQLLDSIEEIMQEVLSTRLKEVGKDGLIERKIYHESPVRVEYYMTRRAWQHYTRLWTDGRILNENTALRTSLR